MYVTILLLLLLLLYIYIRYTWERKQYNSVKNDTLRKQLFHHITIYFRASIITNFYSQVIIHKIQYYV